MNPRLESARFPYLPLRIETGGRAFDVEALLDTGFDGDVALPAQLVGDRQPADEYAFWTLADGSEVLADLFLGTVRVGPFDPSPVVITAIGDEPLVGRGVSDRFIVTLDHGRRLAVGP